MTKPRQRFIVPHRGISSVIIACLMLRSTQAQPNSTDVELHSLISTDWEFQLQHFPALSRFTQDRRWLGTWPDLSREGIRSMEQNARNSLVALRKINQSDLSANALLDYQLFERELLNRMEEISLKAFLTPFQQIDRFGPSALNVLGYIGSERSPLTIDELKQCVRRLNTFPEYLDQQIQLLRDAKAEEMFPSRERVQ